METFMIFNFKLAKVLLDEGFKIVDMAVNRKDPSKIVFYFEDSKELRETFKALQNKQL